MLKYRLITRIFICNWFTFMYWFLLGENNFWYFRQSFLELLIGLNATINDNELAEAIYRSAYFLRKLSSLLQNVILFITVILFFIHDLCWYLWFVSKHFCSKNQCCRSGSAWIHIIGSFLDPDPYGGHGSGSGSRGKKTEKSCSKFYYFLLIHMQLLNFIILIIHMYDITKEELTFDFQCFENHRGYQ